MPSIKVRFILALVGGIAMGVYALALFGLAELVLRLLAHAFH